MRAFTPEQAAAFLEAAEHDEHGTLFTVALATGMRPGELLGLQWPEVDLEKGAQRSHNWWTGERGQVHSASISSTAMQ